MTPEVADKANGLPGARPCPSCDYDLRAQTVPRCPECGRVFASFEDLARASEAAARVFNRVLRWRIRIAIAIGIAIVPTLACSLSAIFFRRLPLLFLGGYVLVAATSAAAFVLLFQVLRWRFDSRIPRGQRRELNGSIPLLLVFSLPFLLLAFTVFAFAMGF